MDRAASGIKVELFTDDGVRLQCIDEAKGVYLLGKSCKLVYLMSPPMRSAAS
jgi:hypothetical protein